MADNTNYSVTATATYDAGAMPKTNIGNDAPAVQIPAGSKSATASQKITGFRNFFYGVVKTTDLNSDVIRGLTAGGAYNSAKTFNVNVTVNDGVGIVVAYPASSSRAGVKEVLLTTSMNADITASYKVVANVNVEGANGATAVAYKVYLFKPDALTSGQNHKITLA